jgi:NTP pyrophosphatase (non-canonical NTP hydrolase)
MSFPYTDLPAYQERVATFVDAHAMRASAESRALDLAAEVGEVAKEVLKSTRYGEEPFSPSDGWADEIADVFFALICLANTTGVDLDRALDGALAKYAARIVTSGEASSGR